jgi:hypothetical protein
LLSELPSEVRLAPRKDCLISLPFQRNNYMRAPMPTRKLIFQVLPLCLLASALSAFAQMQPEQTDPLARIRDAAKSNVAACSATAETLCEQVAPKILENALGESPQAENLRRLTDEIGGRMTGTPELTRAIAWGAGHVVGRRNAS